MRSPLLRMVKFPGITSLPLAVVAVSFGTQAENPHGFSYASFQISGQLVIRGTRVSGGPSSCLAGSAVALEQAPRDKVFQTELTRFRPFH